MEHPVVIPHGRETLAADYAAGGADAVIFLPGWSGTRYGPQRILLQTAHALAPAGFTTMRLDFRGRGDSTGAPGATTLDDMIADTLAAIDWLHGTQPVARIHLVGLCSGGNVALGVASLLPAVSHVVCWSLLPFMEHKAHAAQQGRDRRTILRQMVRKALQPETWRKLLRGEANVHGAVQVLAKDKEGDAGERQRKTSNRDILAALTTFPGHFHLLYGSRDPEAAGSQAFYEDWCRRHHIAHDVRIIPGAPHNFYTAYWTAEVVKQTVTWLTEEQK
jgi:pimeloyl-ACP methyl ester carboxylesterase